MFGVLWAALAGFLFFAFEPVFNHGGPARYHVLPGALLCAAGIAAVFWRWSQHPGGLFDWIQGGVVDVTSSDPERLSWLDWAIAITRRGTIDTRAGWVRLERRLVFGLVPLNVVERRLDEFYRVEVKVTTRESRRRHRSFFSDDRYQVVGYDYAVYLVDRRGDRLCVLDLSTGLTGRGEGFVGGLRQLLEDAVGRPGLVRRPDFSPRGPAADDRAPGDRAPGEPRKPGGRAAADDFEAWRAKREKRPGS